MVETSHGPLPTRTTGAGNKRKRDDVSSDDDDLESLVERSDSSKLTWLELDKAPSLECISQDHAYRLPCRALTELAGITAEERKTLVLQTPAIPNQFSFTAIGIKVTKQVHALRQVSQALNQATRLLAYGVKELLSINNQVRITISRPYGYLVQKKRYFEHYLITTTQV